MVYKGCVLKEEKNHIVVLTHDANYMKLKKKGHIDIGKEILFLEEDIIKTPSIRPTSLTAIAAALIILLITTTLLRSFGVPLFGNPKVYAMVSLDINPSIHFQLDQERKVQKVIPLNAEAKDLFDPSMIGMPIEDVIHLTIRKAIDHHYLTNQSDMVLISKVDLKGHDDELSNLDQDITKIINEDQDIQDIEILYIDSSKDTLKNSQKDNISIGKYELYQQIKEEHPEEELEDIKELKITEIINNNKTLIKAKSFVKSSKNGERRSIQKEEKSDTTNPPDQKNHSKDKVDHNPKDKDKLKGEKKDDKSSSSNNNHSSQNNMNQNGKIEQGSKHKSDKESPQMKASIPKPKEENLKDEQGNAENSSASNHKNNKKNNADPVKDNKETHPDHQDSNPNQDKKTNNQPEKEGKNNTEHKANKESKKNNDKNNSHSKK